MTQRERLWETFPFPPTSLVLFGQLRTFYLLKTKPPSSHLVQPTFIVAEASPEESLISPRLVKYRERLSEVLGTREGRKQDSWVLSPVLASASFVTEL